MPNVSPDTIAKNCIPEVDDKSKPTAGMSKIGQHDWLDNSGHILDSFDLNHDSAVDQKVEPVASIQHEIAIHKRNGLLTLESNPPERQLFCQTFLIHCFEEAGTQDTVYFDCTPDNGMR